MSEVSPSTVDFSNQIFHVLMPRNTRTGLVISVPSYVLSEDMHSAIVHSLKDTYDSAYIEILKITQMEPESGDEPDKTSYEVIFMTVPNQLIDKLHGAGVKNCIFYIGLSENNKEFPVMNGMPLSHDLALTNREGTLCPYMSKLITFDGIPEPPTSS